MKTLNALLDWKLLKKSHRWPGPDGGTCINEAAIVVAGFEYRSVKSWVDCPPCFSTVLSAFLISLNDAMGDDCRQSLLRYVLKLPGSADTLKVEHRRFAALTDRLCALASGERHLAWGERLFHLAWGERLFHHEDEEAHCAWHQVEKVAGKIARLKSVDDEDTVTWLSKQITYDMADQSGRLVDLAAHSALKNPSGSQHRELLKAIDAAFAIGKQADPIATEKVEARIAWHKDLANDPVVIEARKADAAQ
jgi:hypothetical protein